MEKINKTTTLGIGIFVLLTLIGTTYMITSDNAYMCNDNNQTIVGLCFKLSAVNSEGLQTRCYYNSSAPRKYKNCKTGWIKFDNKSVIGRETNMTTYIEYSKFALKKDFIKKVDAEVYITNLKKETKSNVTVLKTEQRPFSDDIRVYWNVLIYKENYEETENGTIIHREVLSNETLYSVFLENVSSTKINNTISEYASEYIQRWKPNIII